MKRTLSTLPALAASLLLSLTACDAADDPIDDAELGTRSDAIVEQCSMSEIRDLQSYCRSSLCGGAGSVGIVSCTHFATDLPDGDVEFGYAGTCACRSGARPRAAFTIQPYE